VGGDGFADFDILNPLMAWVESGAAPDRIVAGQAAFDGPPTGLPPKMDGPPPTLPPRGAVVIKATRPVFAFPMVARYAGPADASSVAAWTAAQPETPEPMRYDWAGSGFYAPQTPIDFTAAADGVRPSLNPDQSRSEPPRAQ
jgi:feruloyl esterase